MPIATKESVAERNGMYQGGGLQTRVADRMLTAKGDKAEREAREVITDSKYDDIKDNKVPGDDDYDDLEEAESYLVFGMALRSFNLRLTKKGGAVRRTGIVDNENDLMSASEAQEYADDAYGDGIDLLERLADEEDREARVVYHL